MDPGSDAWYIRNVHKFVKILIMSSTRGMTSLDDCEHRCSTFYAFIIIIFL